MGADRRLSFTELVVLGLIAEGRTHGFALTRELLPEGPLGRIWTIHRPIVYRAISTLTARGLVREVGSEIGGPGPRRRLIEATAEGRRALDRWLDEPVAHVRDVRSELMMKLLLLERSGRDPGPLLAAQAKVLQGTVAVRVEQLARSDGFDSTLARLRLYSTEAAARLVTELIDEQPPRVDRPAPRSS